MVRQGSLFGIQPPPTYPVPSEAQKRDRGMGVSAAKNAEYLELFRSIALVLTPLGGLCDIEMVRDKAEEEGVQYVPGNWMGSVFKEARWEYVDMVPSRHAGGHARRVMRWRRQR